MSDFQFACESGELAAWEDQIGDEKDSAFEITRAACGCNPSFDVQCAEHSNENFEWDEESWEKATGECAVLPTFDELDEIPF